MKRKKTGLAAVVLNGVCAVIGTGKAALELACRTYDDAAFWYALSILCAALWIVAFVINLKRYRSDRED